MGRTRARYDGARVRADLAKRGWSARDLARASGRSAQTIGRFLADEIQSPKTAAAIAQALGTTPRRYFSHVVSVPSVTGPLADVQPN